MKVIDLTDEKYQGNFGHDILDALTTPGKYIIPLRIDDDIENIEVNIDRIELVRSNTMQLIHTSDKNVFNESNWAYYNGNEQCFKDSISLEEIIEEFEEDGKLLRY